MTSIFKTVLRDVTGAARRDAEGELRAVKVSAATAKAAFAVRKQDAQRAAAAALSKAKADVATALKNSAPEVQASVTAALEVAEKSILASLA